MSSGHTEARITPRPEAFSMSALVRGLREGPAAILFISGASDSSTG